MPFNRKKRMGYRPRRRYRRRKATKRTRIARKMGKASRKFGRIGMGNMPFPKTLYTCLTYKASQVLTISVASSFGTYRLNSLFDPDLTGVGAQPKYFDTLCGTGNAPYNRFRVHAAKISVTFVPRSSSATINEQGICGILVREAPASGISTGLDAIVVAEDPRVKYRNVRNYATLFGQKSTTVSRYVKVANWLSVKDIKDDPDTAGTASTNPIRSLLADVFVSNYPNMAAGGTMSMNAIITIKYFCSFFELDIVPQS